MMSTNSKSGCASCFATPQIGKARLLLVLAQSLHCTGFYQRVYNSTRVHTATIFGIRSHLERVALLYGLLAPMMITKAQTVKAENWHESTVVRCRSFMTVSPPELVSVSLPQKARWHNKAQATRLPCVLM